MTANIKLRRLDPTILPHQLLTPLHPLSPSLHNASTSTRSSRHSFARGQVCPQAIPSFLCPRLQELAPRVQAFVWRDIKLDTLDTSKVIHNHSHLVDKLVAEHVSAAQKHDTLQFPNLKLLKVATKTSPSLQKCQR